MSDWEQSIFDALDEPKKKRPRLYLLTAEISALTLKENTKPKTKWKTKTLIGAK
jgi:hypothetical protein